MPKTPDQIARSEYISSLARARSIERGTNYKSERRSLERYFASEGKQQRTPKAQTAQDLRRIQNSLGANPPDSLFRTAEKKNLTVSESGNQTRSAYIYYYYSPPPEDWIKIPDFVDQTISDQQDALDLCEYYATGGGIEDIASATGRGEGVIYRIRCSYTAERKIRKRLQKTKQTGNRKYETATIAAGYRVRVDVAIRPSK